MKNEIAFRIQPVSIHTPDVILNDLQRRIESTRWMNPMQSKGWDHGVDPDYLKEFLSYWKNDFNWRAQEEKLNSFHHFIVGVEDYDIHFIHEKGNGVNSMPILLLHGWPDSFYRFNKIIPMLTDPASGGMESKITFDVVVPSLPGFGFTRSPQEVNPHQPMRRTASLLFTLMTEVLGYSKFVIAGGDGGSPLAQTMAIDYPEAVKAIYITDAGWHTQGVDISTLNKTERKYAEKGKQEFMQQGAYAMVQVTKPQSLSYALNDSPAALASWILDRFYFWCDGGGDFEKCFTKDELLTNIMIYWTTQTIGSSMRAYRMETLSPTLTSKDYVNTPTGLGLFPKDIAGIPPREFVERTVNVQHWTEFDRGGHFTAWEEPELMAADVLEILFNHEILNTMPLATHFHIDIPESSLIDLDDRLQTTRWPDELNNSGWDYGTNLAYLKELTEYWLHYYDWRSNERRLNEWPHYKIIIDEQEIHFIHIQSKVPNALPIILTHGWPDSFLRFEKLVPMLTDPERHGGNSTDAFNVVIPSIPGFAFSEPSETQGSLFNIHNLWTKLMTDVLGYEKFAAHGGDWGSLITEHLARSHSNHVIGIHLTDVPFIHSFQKPNDPSEDEKKYFEEMEQYQMKENAYAMIQGTRPHTLGAGLNDSPVGLAAWIVEKFYNFSDCNGDIESRFTKDQLLTNISLYWHTQTIPSSFALYYDTLHANMFTWIGEKIKEWMGTSSVPAGFAISAKENTHPPREWAERFFNVQRWTTVPQGGHFAALEEPRILANELIEFFRTLR